MSRNIFFINQTKLAITLTFVCAIIIFCILLYNGVIWFNNPSKDEYPVRGIDVSSYQGDIDWNILSKQDIQFAFIKATEGSNFQDEKFRYNWEHARKTSLKIGAYHFFSYDSGGITQAENFIKTVPKIEQCLPPVVDIEFYADKEKNPPSKEKTVAILKDLLTMLEFHYGKKPIIYATMKSYDLYIKFEFEGYPIWIRNVLTYPKLTDNSKWTFWQYSHRQRLDGYKGFEKYIDMNVFNGTVEEFHSFAK